MRLVALTGWGAPEDRARSRDAGFDDHLTKPVQSGTLVRLIAELKPTPDFMRFTGIDQPEQFRIVAPAHVLAWRRDLEQRALSGATIRRKLAALALPFAYLCESHAVTHNPVEGVRRPRIANQEGKTPGIGDYQARALLNMPDSTTLRGRRDCAILSMLLYHALRRAELCTLTVGDVQPRRGVMHLRVHGKGDKLRLWRCIRARPN